MNVSLTITGLVIFIIGVILDKLGVPIAEGAVESFVSTAIEVIGAIVTFFGRYRQGDISLLGRKKKVASSN